ncbi:hypothetical protein C8Q70DRAFT_1018172, partial [Cubamyces menziesii]
APGPAPAPVPAPSYLTPMAASASGARAPTLPPLSLAPNMAYANGTRSELFPSMISTSSGRNSASPISPMPTDDGDECAVERVVDRSQACPGDGPDACCACARERGRESVCRPAGPTYAAARAEALCAV